MALLNQWYSEVQKFKFKNIFTSSDTNWLQNFDNILFNSKEFGLNENLFFITTYATFNKNRFQTLLNKYSWD